MLDSVIFWVIAVLSVGSALGAITTRSTIHAALFLIVVFMSIAGVYLLNNADFLAIAQIIIYAVGLTILMLFGIMFTGDKTFDPKKVSHTARIASGIVIAYVFALLLRGLLIGPGPVVPMMSADVAAELVRNGSTAMLGELLFNQYALPFELASILLLAAMIGAIVIAKKQFTESSEDLLGEMRLPVDANSAPPEAVIEALRRARLGESTERKSTIGSSEANEQGEASEETPSLSSH